MKRHPFRWEGLVFGLVFLVVVSTWLRSLGLFDPDQFAYVFAAGLIIVGVAGILATVVKPRPVVTGPTSPAPTDRPVSDQAGSNPATADQAVSDDPATSDQAGDPTTS